RGVRNGSSASARRRHCTGRRERRRSDVPRPHAPRKRRGRRRDALSSGTASGRWKETMNNIDAEIDRLIAPGRVHRRSYSHTAIFEVEMDRIFGGAWIYVGHESQVKKPGDYFATRMGRKPVVLVRDEEGAVRVIHNQCAHRGALVVATDQGNAAEF